MVLKVKNALYGLRRSAYPWYCVARDYLISIDFELSKADACLFRRTSQKGNIFIILHVDDFGVASTSPLLLQEFISQISKQFSVKDLGPITRYLSYNVEHHPQQQTITLHQNDFIADTLNRAGMSDCHPSKSKGDLFLRGLTHQDSDTPPEQDFPYRNIVGCLQHLASHFRPDIAFETATLAKFCQKPRPGMSTTTQVSQIYAFLGPNSWWKRDSRTIWLCRCSRVC
jgi:hypothetical protein